MIDVTGTWDEPGADLTWQITQSGSAVTGTSRFSQNNGRYLGPASGNGRVTGSVANGVFSVTDTYSDLTSPVGCSVVVTGTLTVSGTRMSGGYVETDSCNGSVLGTITGTLSLQKR